MNLDELKQLCEERHLDLYGLREGRQRGLPTKPHQWKGADLFEGLARASEVVGMETVAMRLIQPRVPSLPEMSRTIYCTVQSLLPGERTRGHRNNGSETRFVIKGAPGAEFVIEGEAFPVEEGDFITTPSWAWHDHYNNGTESAIWLDGMESRLVSLGGGINEPAPGGHQKVTKPNDFTLHTLGNVRPSWIKSELPTPPRRYAWTETYEALTALKEAKPAGDPYDGIYLQYVNPLTGGPTLPTRNCGIHLFPPGMNSRFQRRNCTAIYYAFRGEGVIKTEDEEFEWTQGDLLVMPAWTQYAHVNPSNADAILFSITDQPTTAALGLYREERD